MRLPTLALLFILATSTIAQNDAPRLPKTGNTFATFIPERWPAIDTACGDLNNDGTDDVVLVLQCQDTIPGDTTGASGTNAPPRKLVVLFAEGAGYSLAVDNDRFILRADEGGWFDPFEGMEVKDGALNISFYGGSAWRYSNTYTFQWLEGAFMLIAAETVSYHVAEGNGEKHNYDFLTHRGSTTTGNMTEADAANKTTWKDLPMLKPMSLDALLRPFVWEVEPGIRL